MSMSLSKVPLFTRFRRVFVLVYGRTKRCVLFKWCTLTFDLCHTLKMKAKKQYTLKGENFAYTNLLDNKVLRRLIFAIELFFLR